MLSGSNVGIAVSGACTGTVVDRNLLNGNGTGVSLSSATGVEERAESPLGFRL